VRSFELALRDEERPWLFDGAMGTILLARGAAADCCEAATLRDPQLVRAIHAEYVAAGAAILTTNTFGANRARLEAAGLARQVAEINRKGVELARGAAGGEAYIAGSMGPLGTRLEPDGHVTAAEARSLFREPATALAAAGVDLFVLETFSQLTEIEAAIAAVRAVSDRPLVAQFTADVGGQTAGGRPVEHWARALQEWGADAVGVNCSDGPTGVLEAIRRVRPVTRVPLSAQPSAGLPRPRGSRLAYPHPPADLAIAAQEFLALGVRFIGSCCGTTPEYTRAIAGVLRDDRR
jgi:homocysteine S-methyltransferase